MKIAETVTFGGSGLDRAAHLRADKAAINRALPSGEFILFWRGKPLLSGEDKRTLARLPLATIQAIDASSEYVFLGIDNETPVFATQVDAWSPEDVDFASLGAFLDPSEQRHPDLPESMCFAELRAVMSELSPRDAELVSSAKAILSWHDSHRFCSRCGKPSDMAMSGWQRDCGSCGGQHFPRTDPVVIMLVTSGNSVLLGRSPGWPEGMYSCLAGFVEPGETIEAAVRREVFEESGIRVGRVDYLASQPWPFPTTMMIGCLGRAETTDITIDPNELDDAIWVTKEEIVASFSGESATIKPARKGSIAHFILWNWVADRLD